MGIKEAYKALTISETTNQLEYSPFIISIENPKLKFIEETFKGNVELNTIKFPAELGEEHPFDFKLNENLYKTFGLVQAIIDKYVDSIIGVGFYVRSEDKRAEEIIKQFIEDVNFDEVLRHWIKESLIKGNGFLEIVGVKDQAPVELKVLDANRMYIQMNESGSILGYNQLRAKNINSVNIISKDNTVHFEDYEIAHVPINRIGDCPYGFGIIESVKGILKSLVENEEYLNQIMKKKAEVKYHIKFGDAQHRPTDAVITSMRNDLTFQRNAQEWVTDGLTDIKTLDFGNPGDKFSFPLEHNLQMCLYSFQVPEVLMGKGNIAEGLAKAQLDMWERRNKSFQTTFERVIEQKIFSRVLLSNNIQSHVEFEWGQPSNDDKIQRLIRLNELLKLGFMLSPTLKKEIEKDIARQLDYNEELLETIEEEKERELTQPQPLVPGQNRQEYLEEGWVILKDGRKIQVGEDIFEPVNKSTSEHKARVNMIKDYNSGKTKLVNRVSEGDYISEMITTEHDTYDRNVIKRKDVPEPVVRGRFMGQYEEAHGVSKTEWDKLPYEKKAELENKVQLKKFGKGYFEEECVEMYRPDMHDEWRKSRKDKYHDNTIDRKKIIDIFEDIQKQRKNKKKEFIKTFTQEELKENYTIKEWLNFNFPTYLKSIINFIREDNFKDLAADNDLELQAGYLNTKQVNRLKHVLIDGFNNDRNIIQINKDVNEIVKIKDLLLIENNQIKLDESGNPIIALNQESRSMMVTRTEITRVGVNGALDFYDDNNVENVQFVASLGLRTCQICNDLNGRVYTLEESYDIIPQHSNCRCSFIPQIV